MGTWKTESRQITGNVSNFLNNATSKLHDVFSSVTRQTVSDVRGFFTSGSTVVGINTNQIEPMKQAIRDYVQKVETELKKLEDKNPEQALKGSEIVPAIKQYIESVKEACGSVTSNMLAFNDRLTDVQEKYREKDTNTAQAINSEAGTVRSSYNRYTEGTR